MEVSQSQNRPLIDGRIMIAATGSGSGKTMITCALLEALKQRGLDPVSFKCGPDYIDPLFHKKILETDSRNLDLFFAGKEGVREIMASCSDRYAVIEGVMGIYDGNGPESIEGSCYEVALALKTPVILVVDASGTGRTVISLIKGILSDDTGHLIKGVLLNRISENFYEKLRPVLEKVLFKIRDDVKLIGFFPKVPGISIGSRYLGLMLPEEIGDVRAKIREAASVLEKHAKVDEIISIMEGADEIAIGTKAPEKPVTSEYISGESPTLAVAYDEAFCFYYRDNLDLFRENGVDISFFSPLHDRSLPEKCDGILIGGGYPEEHLKELSENETMMASIREAVHKGIPSLAECGGFMYLHRTVSDIRGKAYEMTGIIDGECHYSGHLVRFGYMQIEAENESGSGDPLSRSLVGMKGHEFHYYESSLNGRAYTAVKPGQDRRWECMIKDHNGIWGFPHFYYRSDPEFVGAFAEKMREMKKRALNFVKK